MISYQASQEQRLKAEIREYIVTESIEQQLERLLEKMQAAMEAGGGHEVGVWVSGFYGSGKSSFTKYLGLAFDQRVSRRPALPSASAGSRPQAHHESPAVEPSRRVSPRPSSCSISRASRSPVRRSPRYRLSSTTRSSNMPATAEPEGRGARAQTEEGRSDIAEFEGLFREETGEAGPTTGTTSWWSDSVLPSIAHRLYPALFRNDQAFTTASSESSI